MKLRIGSVVVAFLWVVVSAAAQTASSPAVAQVPPLIQFSNVGTDEGGNTLSGVLTITFSLYSSQLGGEPLWTETQNNVQLDPTGHYSVQLGITKANGVPTALFTTGEARWLGVRIAEQGEQPRVLLLSVPYALKAGDAATIGGLPPSAFVLAAPQNEVSSTYIAEPASGQSASPDATATDVTTTGGTADYLPVFNGTSTIIDSVVFQSGTGTTAKIGIGTTTPTTTLDIKGGSTVRGVLTLPASGAATATAGKNSQPLSLVASAFSSGTSTAVNQTFHWLGEPAGNDTASPSATLNLLFGEGTAVPAETGLHIASNGQITFATGQTFPGTGTGDGTVTSVASGAGLTGGPITGIGTLKIAAAGVTNTMLLHPSLTVTAGSDLTGGGAVALGAATTLNLDTTKVPLLVANNTFTGEQVFTGNYGWFQNGLYGEPFIEAYGAGNGTALFGLSDSTAPTTPTLYLENDDSTNAGDWVFDAVGPNYGGQCTIDLTGNLFCTGVLEAVASVAGNRKVGLYSVQSSEDWVEDFGSGRLSGGVAKVELEPHFGQTVTAANYHVFLTPAGDCQGLYIANRTPTSFEVHELKGGKSNVEFDYRIVAHRRGFETTRLPDVTSRFAGKVARPAGPRAHQARVVAEK
ncbi:MAG: hypothetical protein WA555_12635 [Candidatus Sulfotelmatobacter sp.]